MFNNLLSIRNESQSIIIMKNCFLELRRSVFECHGSHIFKGVAPFRQCRHLPTHFFFLKMPQNEAAAIDICVMYRPDQPALSAQTGPADTFRLGGIDV